MVGCAIDDDCPFMFLCNQQQTCQHKPIFPIQWYPFLIYLLLPIGSGFVNIVGKSMGILKVTILMNLLRYNASQSTALIQPMVAGSALPNVINVVFKKHPKRQTSLVDYDIVLIIIPCSLLGSTLGSFLEKLTPELIKDIIMIVFFSSFAYSFYKKAKTFSGPQPQPLLQQPDQKIIPLQSSSQSSDPSLPQLTLAQQQQKQKILQYERTIHLTDIIISIVVFIVFQFLAFLVQGKFGFYKFHVCTWEYIVGLAVLVMTTIGYEEIVRRVLRKRYQLYGELGVRRNVDFGSSRNFGWICFAGYFAGLAQGILGVGSGTFIMGTFMYLNIDPRVAAATSSYQILFIGLSAFIQDFITNSIKLQQALFLFLLIFIGGGLFTLFLYYMFKKMQQKKLNKFLVYVMFALSLMNAIFIVPYLVQLWIDFGIGTLISVPFHC